MRNVLMLKFTSEEIISMEELFLVVILHISTSPKLSNGLKKLPIAWDGNCSR